METTFTEEKLKEVLKDATVQPDRSFFDDNYSEKTPPLSDDPTEGERWRNADDARFEVNPEEPVDRMEISIIKGGRRLGSVYQDALDGCVYPTSEGGEPFSDEVRTLLIEKDAAFDGCMEDPAVIVGFVTGIPPSEFVCEIADGSADDADVE